jgi:hypothetical protein
LPKSSARGSHTPEKPQHSVSPQQPPPQQSRLKAYPHARASEGDQAVVLIEESHCWQALTGLIAPSTQLCSSISQAHTSQAPPTLGAVQQNPASQQTPLQQWRVESALHAL